VGSIVVTFSDLLQRASATKRASFGVFRLQRNHRVPVPLGRPRYDGADTMTVRLRRPVRLLVGQLLLVRVKGTHGGVKDAYGRLIDGNADGQPGGDYTRLVGTQG
jgi:hypothetical protein